MASLIFPMLIAKHQAIQSSFSRIIGVLINNQDHHCQCRGTPRCRRPQEQTGIDMKTLVYQCLQGTDKTCELGIDRNEVHAAAGY